MSSRYSNVDQRKMLAFYLSAKQGGYISRFFYNQNMHGSIFGKLIHSQASSSFPGFLSQFLVCDDHKPPRLCVAGRRRQTCSFKYPFQLFRLHRTFFIIRTVTLTSLHQLKKISICHFQSSGHLFIFSHLY